MLSQHVGKSATWFNGLKYALLIGLWDRFMPKTTRLCCGFKIGPKKATSNYFWSHLKGEAIFARPMDRKVFLKHLTWDSSIASDNFYLAAETCPTSTFSHRILATIEAGWGGETICGIQIFWILRTVGCCGHLTASHNWRTLPPSTGS